MSTTHLNAAFKNFDQMEQMVARYTRLCRAYIRLSERFQELDMDHMALKEQLVAVLKSNRQQQERHQQQLQENETLRETLAALKAEQVLSNQALAEEYDAKVDAMAKSLEEVAGRFQTVILNSEVQAVLGEAEQHAELLEETFTEMDADSDPDLSPDDKFLLEEFQANPAAFDEHQEQATSEAHFRAPEGQAA